MKTYEPTYAKDGKSLKGDESVNRLQVIEQDGVRVLTTSQISEAFEADMQIITNNFNRNKNRYIRGKHFFLLEGQDLRDFRATNQIDLPLNVTKLYLWTEKGAWMHAKSLNTDKAWEAYEALVDDYYEKVEQSIDVSKLSLEMQMFNQMFNAVAKMQLEHQETRRQLADVTTTVSVIQETFLQRDEDWRKSINSMLNAAAFRLGGKYRDLRNESYRLLEERARCNLGIRLENLLERLKDSGATKTKLNNTTRMDVIESDLRLKEIYTAIVKELSIGSLKAMTS